MRIEPMKTNRIAPIVERHYREGSVFQWVRETVINAMEAGATRIEFDIEWQAVARHNVYRRTICDNGKGMTGDELRAFFNTLGEGGKPIGGADENFGVGAKTSLLPWNPFGVVVLSYVDGVGAMIRILRDPLSGEYGLFQFDAEDDAGNSQYASVVEPFDDEVLGVDWRRVKPDWIDQHGTVIVLLGNDENDDTVVGDKSRAEKGIKDIARYLNHRLWRRNDVDIRVYELTSTEKSAWPRQRVAVAGRGGMRRKVEGVAFYLLAGDMRQVGFTVQTGMVPMTDGETEIDWYLWPHGQRPIWHYRPKDGFIGVLYDNEVYDRKDQLSTFRTFGITHGSVARRLWLVIRPPKLDERRMVGVYPVSARNRLSWSAGRDLPITEWAEAFADRMPEEIQEALRSASGDNGGSINDQEWRERLSQRFSALWRVERMRPDSQGVGRMGLQTTVRVNPQPGEHDDDQSQVIRPRRPRPAALSQQRQYGQTGTDQSASSIRVTGGIPDYSYTNDESDMEPGMLAVYNKPPSGQNRSGEVLIYRHHPVLQNVIRYHQQHRPPHQAEDVAKVIEEVYGEVVVAKVAHSQSMAALVDQGTIDDMRSPMALTMALLGLVSEEAMILERLRNRVGGRRRQTARSNGHGGPAIEVAEPIAVG